MITKEISAGLSGVVPLSSYENLRPSFTMTVEPENGETADDCFAKIKEILHRQFDAEANKAKVDLVEKQYENIRFRERNGKKYPSVTSILDWDKTWRVSPDELKQYASRGTIVHKLLEIFLKTGKWENPYEISELKEDVAILLGGSLGLSWEDCAYREFMEQYKDKIEVAETEKTVFNDEHLYSGRYDIKGRFNGVPAIMDFKTGSFDMRQLAAYAVCEDDIEVLVALPVGPTDNKCGYKKPVIETKIQDQFKEFLRARAKFRARFGV